MFAVRHCLHRVAAPPQPDFAGPPLRVREARWISTDQGIRMTTHPLIIVEGLSKVYSSGATGSVRAVDNISFDMVRGETLALVGESGGWGKSAGRWRMR